MAAFIRNGIIATTVGLSNIHAFDFSQPEISSNPIHPDSTIRPLGAFPDSESTNYCIYKRWNDYVAGQELWLWPCADATHQNIKKSGKYRWNFDNTTGLIKSMGSEELRPNKPFCWYIHKPNSMWGQRLKIKACDENSDQQKFKYENGKFFLENYPKICVGFEVSDSGGFQKVAMTVMKCHSNNFARFDLENINPGISQEEIDGYYNNGFNSGYITGRDDGIASIVTTLGGRSYCGNINFETGTGKCCDNGFVIPLTSTCAEVSYPLFVRKLGFSLTCQGGLPNNALGTIIWYF